MKKTSKSILSLLLVFLFVFQFAGSAGIAAFADDDTDKAEETETFSVAIKVNGEDYTAPVSRAKLEGGVEFTPSDGAYVKSVSVNGIGVTGFCIAEGRVLTIDSDAVIDMLNDVDKFANVDSFTVSAEVEKLPEGLENITAPAADSAELGEGREFVCWKYKYANKAIVLVEAGETFTPFMSCEFIGPISRAVESNNSGDEQPANGDEQPANGDAQPAPAAPLLSPAGTGAGTPTETYYKVTIKANDGSKSYDGQPAPALDNSKFTIEQFETNDASLTPLDKGKVSVSGIVLSYDRDIKDTYQVGDYAIKADTSKAQVSYDGKELDPKKVTFVVNDGKFSVTKVNLVIKAKDVSKTYDGSKLPGDFVAEGLLGGHTVSGVKYIGETSAVCNTTYKLDKSSGITIKNSGGSDVSGVYNVTVSEDAAKYVITAPDKKVKLSVKAADVTKNYTGSPIEGSITIDGTLPEGATVTAVYEYKDEHTAIGTHKYSLKSISVMQDGHDISSMFDITLSYVEATLTIIGHSYTITVKDAVKEYDGKPLKASDYSVTGLMEGDRIYAISFTGEQTEAGLSYSDVDTKSVIIHNSKDEDVTASYSAPTINKGKLTVDKLEFTVTAKDATKIYDGKPLTCNQYVLSGTDKAKLDKLGSWTLNVVVSGSRVEVGSSANKVGTVELKVGDIVVDAKNYSVIRKDGTLTVEADSTKPTLTITVESKTKVYDGTSLILDPKAYTVSDSLPTGYSIEVTLEKASITAAGSKTVSVDSYKIYRNNVLVSDPAEYPFNVALKTGTLTVTKYPITITADSGTKYYNGKEFVLNSVTITAPNNKLVDGQKAEITVEAQDSAGNKVKAIKVGKYYNVVTQVVIKDGNTDVTSNYDITTINGTLTIKNSNGNPQTGDTSNIGVWATVLAVSAVAVACIVVVVIVRGKKKSK